MKTFAKLSLLALAGFSLVACGLNPGPNGQSKPVDNGWGGKAKSVEPYKPSMPASEDDGYVEPTQEIEDFPTYRLPKEAEEPVDEPNIQPDEWAGYTPADPKIAEPVTVYTPEAVICDVVVSSGNNQYDADTLKQYNYIQEIEPGVWLGHSVVHWTSDLSDQLPDVLEYYIEAMGRFPAYLSYVEGGEPYASTLQSGEPCGVAFTKTPDNLVWVQLLDYVENGTTELQFLAAAPEYFQA